MVKSIAIVCSTVDLLLICKNCDVIANGNNIDEVRLIWSLVDISSA